MLEVNRASVVLYGEIPLTKIKGESVIHLQRKHVRYIKIEGE